jgi:hypothetical protein
VLPRFNSRSSADVAICGVTIYHGRRAKVLALRLEVLGGFASGCWLARLRVPSGFADACW